MQATARNRMRELESHSIEELEKLTGFDRRTISYYISEGLLPKVGRRGRNTRYGKVFVDRLKFIQRVKDLQDAGKLPSVTLDDIAVLLERLTADEVLEAGKSNKKLLELFAETIESAGKTPGREPTMLADNEADYAADSLFDDVGFEAVESRMATPGQRRRLYSQARPSAESEADMEQLLRQMRELYEATARDMRDMHEAHTRQLQRLEEQTRELREELKELRRGVPRPGALEYVNRRGRQWARVHGLDDGPVRVARYRPDECCWEFPIDPKLLMLRNIDLVVVCEGRPGIDRDSFVPLRISATSLLLAVKSHEKRFSSQAARRCRVFATETPNVVRYDRVPGIELDKYRIDEAYRLHADKGA